MSTAQPAAEEAPPLKACPFCQGAAALTNVGSIGDEGSGYMWRVGCANIADCLMLPEVYDEYESSAVNRWNTRAQSAAFDALVEAANDCVNRMEKLRELLKVSGARDSQWQILDTVEIRAALAQAAKVKGDR